MSATTGIEHIKHAQKRRRCDWCYEHIMPGEPYARWRWFEESSPASVAVHEECLSAINACDPHEMQDGWTPGDNPRSCNCGGDGYCDKCPQINLIRYMARGGAFA